MHWPKTLAEARKYRYRQWGGNPVGTAYVEGRCAAEVHDEGRSCLSHQCFKPNGKGPEGIYCGIHAKKMVRP